MTPDIVLIITLSLVLIFSPFFAKILQIPTTPVEIVLGAILGYFGFLHESHLFELVAEVGFLFLMFLAGTEVDIQKVLKTKASLMKRILFYLATLYILAIMISLYFGLGKIFIILLPLISVGLVAALSKEFGKTPWLELSMTAGSIGEILSIAGLTLASASLEFGVGVEFFQVIAALVAFIVFIFILFRALQLFFWWYPEVALALMPHQDNKEQDIRLSIGVLFLLISGMMYLDLELAFGAFIAGMFLPTFFKHKHDLPEKLASFGFGFIVPIFFIYIGTSLHLEALLVDGLILTAVVISFAMIMMRLAGSLVFVHSLGLRDALLMGLSHSMPLTLLIALATLAYHANSIDKLHYYALILASLFQVIVVMISIKLLISYWPEKTIKEDSL
ncbi:MAG: cation:proton antiporter [Campylobacterota bacterium]|nr:cation:proton antiporter [Campylobacterota bacterium]